MTTNERTLGYTISTTHEHGHARTDVYVYTGKSTPLRDRLAENYYSQPEAPAVVRAIERTQRQLIGFENFLDTWSDDLYTKISYLHYGDDDYCRATVQVSRFATDPNNVVTAGKFLGKLTRRKGGFPKSPEALVKALGRKAVKLIDWREEGHSRDLLVAPKV